MKTLPNVFAGILQNMFQISDKKQQNFILKSLFKRKDHNVYDGFSCYTYKTLDKIFGRGEFLSMNNDKGLFNVRQHSYVNNYTRGLTPSDYLIECFNEAVSIWWKTVQYKDFNYEKHTGKDNGVLSRNYKGSNTKFKSKVLPVVRVNMNALKVKINSPIKDMVNALDRDQDKELTKQIKRQKLERIQASFILDEALNTNNLPKGWIPQVYVEKKSGRLYTSSRIGLQNVCKSVREVALSGLYSYDISNCHWNVLSQKTTVAMPNIEYYIASDENKNKVRQSLSEKYDLPVKDIKRILLSLMYGARLLAFYKENAIAKICKTPQRHNKLVQDSFIKGVHDEYKLGAKELIAKNKAATGRHSGKIINAMGLICQDSEQSKQLSHLLQGYEVKALEIITSLTRVDTALMLHDGIITYNKHDKKLFERSLKEQLGLDLKIDFEPIECTFQKKKKKATGFTIKGFEVKTLSTECYMLVSLGVFPVSLSLNSLKYTFSQSLNSNLLKPKVSSSSIDFEILLTCNKYKPKDFFAH